ncbi:DNA replication terminus site-binding protein [Plesiomonas shigelloides subsp. oncorhynchi]|nr:DNA replication terminus site-binding protein [Plesiomonas shigelloides]
MNQAKDAFAAAIKAVGNPDQRFEAVHSRFPMMITLQATRYLKVLPCNTTRISFAWQKPIASKSDHDKLNRQSLLEKLTQERRYPPVNIAMQLDGDIWAAQIEEEIALVEALPENARLRYRRVLREVPQANWVYETFDAEQGEIIECAVTVRSICLCSRRECRINSKGYKAMIGKKPKQNIAVL